MVSAISDVFSFPETRYRVSFGNSLPLSYPGLTGVCQVFPYSGLKRSSVVLSPRNVNLDISQLEMSFTLISEEGSSHDFWHSCPDFQMFLDSLSSPQAIPCTEITLREGQKLNEGGPSLRCRFYGCGIVPGICISWTNNSKNSYASDQRTHSKPSLWIANEFYV